jgi:hypothetical protein
MLGDVRCDVRGADRGDEARGFIPLGGAERRRRPPG